MAQGSAEPVRYSATHPAVPPDAVFPTSPLLGGPNSSPAQSPVPSPGVNPPAGSTPPAVPQTITLPSGEVIPVDTRALSKKDPDEAPGTPRKKPIKVDPALLEKMLSGKGQR